MQGEMPEHDEHRIRPVLRVLSPACPICATERLKAGNEALSVCDELIERGIKIHPEQKIVRVLVAG